VVAALFPAPWLHWQSRLHGAKILIKKFFLSNCEKDVNGNGRGPSSVLPWNQVAKNAAYQGANHLRWG
jgi:hypothetical protein